MIEKLLNKLGYYKRITPIADPPVFNVVNYDIKTICAAKEYVKDTGMPVYVIKKEVANVLAKELVDICEYVTEEDPEGNTYRVYAKLHYVEKR